MESLELSKLAGIEWWCLIRTPLHAPPTIKVLQQGRIYTSHSPGGTTFAEAPKTIIKQFPPNSKKKW